MSQRIIYPQDNGLIAVVTPSPNSDLTLLDIAHKDVPAGVPYLIIEDSEMPDFEFHEAWECDFSEPDGYGVGHDAWFGMQVALGLTYARALAESVEVDPILLEAKTQEARHKW